MNQTSQTSRFSAQQRASDHAKAMRIAEARRERTPEDNRLAQLMRTK